MDGAGKPVEVDKAFYQREASGPICGEDSFLRNNRLLFRLLRAPLRRDSVHEV